MILKKINNSNIGMFLDFAIRHCGYSFGEVADYDELTELEQELITESEFYELFDKEPEEEDLVYIVRK